MRTACVAAARRAPFIKAPLWGGTGLAVVLLAALLLWQPGARPDAPADLIPLNVLVLCAVYGVAGHAAAGARLGRHGLLRGRGVGLFVPWHRVRGVSLVGGRIYAVPVLHLTDGTSRPLLDLGALFGLGRARAEQAAMRIADRRAAADLHPLPSGTGPPARPDLPASSRTRHPAGAVLLVTGAVVLAVLTAQAGAALDRGQGSEIVQTVRHEGTEVRVRVHPVSVRGPNFEVLVQESDGSYRRWNPGAEQTYVGSVDGHPGAVVGAVKSADGLYGQISFDRGRTWYFSGDDGRVSKSV